MDVLYFLRERTRFIRLVFDSATAPFSSIKHKIENGEPPFEPPYSEDGEPPFLAEWMEAEEGLQVVGRMCISMLSAALQLYFKTWEDELRLTWESAAERKGYFERGFVAGYRRAFGEVLSLSWDECPADFDVLEQLVLARNRDQHPDHIAKVCNSSDSYRAANSIEAEHDNMDDQIPSESRLPTIRGSQAHWYGKVFSRPCEAM